MTLAENKKLVDSLIGKRKTDRVEMHETMLYEIMEKAREEGRKEREKEMFNCEKPKHNSPRVVGCRYCHNERIAQLEAENKTLIASKYVAITDKETKAMLEQMRDTITRLETEKTAFEIGFNNRSRELDVKTEEIRRLQDENKKMREALEKMTDDTMKWPSCPECNQPLGENQDCRTCLEYLMDARTDHYEVF